VGGTCKGLYADIFGGTAHFEEDPAGLDYANPGIRSALAFAHSTAGNDMPSVGYATVYPLTMFLRVLTAQLMIIIFL